MATLLHLDSAVFPRNSASREVTATFVRTWREQHPQGTVVYRDLAADPLPFIDPEAVRQGAEHPLRAELAAELAAADAVLIGAPMYNFTIAASLKAWLDLVIIQDVNTGPGSETARKPFVVVASRGGSYGPGSPRHGYDFVQDYLTKVLEGMLGVSDVRFIVAELTLAPVKPRMEALRPLAEQSRAQAHEHAAAEAKRLAARLAA